MKLETSEIEALRELLLSNQSHSNPVLQKLLEKMTSNSSTYKMYIDGAADLNTQTSGIGGIVYKGDEEIFTFSEYIHDLTNNEAEYGSLIHGLKSLLRLLKERLKGRHLLFQILLTLQNENRLQKICRE